jgi:hypothetical protein
VGLATRCYFLSKYWSEICGVITQWSESSGTRNHTLLSHLRLPQPGGPGPRIYIAQEQGGPVIPPGTGFPLNRLLRLAPYHSQGYGGGIITLPVYISFRNRMVQSKVKVKSRSHITTEGQSINMSWCLVHSALKGFHPNEFQSDIRRSTLKRNFLLPLGGLHVKHAVQRGIWVPTQHLLLIELAGRRTFRMQTDF